MFGRFLAELAGTFFLVFFGVGAVHSAVLTGAQSGLWQVAVVWAIAIMLAIYAFGSISGAHLNPAITIALSVWGRHRRGDIVPYIIAQTSGGFVAAAVLFLLFQNYLTARESQLGIVRGAVGSEATAMCYGEFFPNPGLWEREEGTLAERRAAAGQRVSAWQALMAEWLGTGILAFVIFAVTDQKNSGAPTSGLAPVAIGLTVAALISVIAPLTQAGFNPARDFGPRLFSSLAGWGTIVWIPGGAWFTVYILAPIVGAVCGGGLYCGLFEARSEPWPQRVP